MENHYSDNAFVYVDPHTRSVKGPVQWSNHGSAIPLEMGELNDEDKNKDRSSAKDSLPLKRLRRHRRKQKRYYPWGTYRSMKKMYNLEGKEKDGGANDAFDEALQRSLKEPFWD